VVLKYLARYVHRSALSTSRLVALTEQEVSFRRKDYAHGGKERVLTVSGQEFLRRFVELLEFTLPRYRREGKSYLTIALGCTGGRHRSIVLVEELRRRLQEAGHRVLVRHRDAER